MKKIATLIAGLVLATAALGQVTGSTYVEIGNKYLDPGFGDVLSEDVVLQPGLDLEFGNGFGGSFWFSHSFNDQERDLGEGLELGLNWSGPLPEKMSLAEGAELEVAVTYCDAPTRLAFGKNDTVFISSRASVPLGNWTHSFNVSRDEPLPGSDFPAAWLFGPGVERTFELGSDFSITTEAELNYGHGYGFDPGFVLNPNVTLDYAFSDEVTWSLMVVSYFQLDTDDERGDELAGSFIVEKSF